MVIGLAAIGPAACPVAISFAGVAGISIGFVDIISADAFGVCIGKDSHRGVADHASGIGIEQFPAFEVMLA